MLIQFPCGFEKINIKIIPNSSASLFCTKFQRDKMIWYILLLFHIVIGEGAIFYVKDDDKKNDLVNLEFLKQLKIETNSDSLKNDVNKIILPQIQQFGSGKYDELVQDQTKHIVSANNKNELESKVDNLFEACKSSVGTSSTPFCLLTQKAPIDKNKHFPKSCQEILESGNNISGIYEIRPRTSIKPFYVLCDMETKGGGWTHIQKRFDGSQDFYLDWREYKFGFGDLDGEFWIGLENIYHMTGFEMNELLIELIDRDQKQAYGRYSVFVLGSETEGYILKDLKGFSGDSGDALTPHKGLKFTTKDVDQDTNPANCAVIFEGAWWYGNCHESNLNGKHMNKPLSAAYNNHGLNWHGFREREYNLAGSRMLIRPVDKN